ncbi:MAG: hypothetical protein A2653_03025 [Candidatus Zambryskibacteria bacterium RIFCSPHIGHO2_01_FULL_43_25]|uniref:HTH arsR-type domain-containing protein n=1 Tax=Candidatus Zambryskibacteria bacterium RIFCSPLOWO2_01_FULL_45_21 TaxID=1802761 RepID=A0A1G2U0B3_9BACT|nr:MAG: hypothetical protein A2653_03025 [Candidatus Zambryskibacteria bacterium RIFCSPHIGHO2_01_FULL_43_25]OHB00326.1 MAG: hypothetical protein A3E94_03080 [Candidatus Zambryskibacteria bacterium RIFCSPHIGHO2_12_FULL_44_12b]OHB02978.1 MAG: hypothetical protein A3B14_00870 [Candidatus Zambryskibacteria bacterium RIFCSPLOWO2_01_FULL_45_21]
MKKVRELEKIVKGFANHRRIQILELLSNKPELSIFEISDILKVNFKTISQHVSRLANSGLILKRNDGSAVRHKLSSLGKSILMFLRTIE